MMDERFAIGVAVTAALVASLCCVGPVLFAALGLGAFTAATLFAAARPYLLALAVLLLAVGFYRTHFRRQPACAPGEPCATKPVNRLERAGLWIATIALLAFAMAPYYIGHFASALGRRSMTTTPATNLVPPASNEAAPTQDSLETITVKVEGMSCTACEVPIRDALARTPGVRTTDVSYRRGDARVEYDSHKTNIDQIKRAIDSTRLQSEVEMFI